MSGTPGAEGDGVPPPTIAVIEADEPTREMTVRFLASGGYRAVATARATEAVDLVRRERAALVLCAVDLPEMDGYAVLKALQADPETARVPVVFLAPREFGERARAFRYGAYVARPFTQIALLQKVGHVLEDLGRRAGVPHDPPALPAAAAGVLPTFDDVPEVLRSVLVVDDNATFRAFLRGVLGTAGFRVHEARDGEEGLRLALEHRPWLILTDVRMPGEDGFAFCRRVRSHSMLRQTPLLFLSGWDDYKSRYEGLELGADDFLSKDTPVRELLIRVQLTLKRHVVSGGRRPGPGMQGQLQVMGAPGVLQTCHLMRLTGTLVVDDGTRHVEVGFRDGEVVRAEGDGATGAEAVYALLGWEQGTFRFAPGDAETGPPLGGFSQLVLEGCRRLDEARRDPAAREGAPAVVPDPDEP